MQAVPFCRKMWLCQVAVDASMHDADLAAQQQWGTYPRIEAIKLRHTGEADLRENQHACTSAGLA